MSAISDDSASDENATGVDSQGVFLDTSFISFASRSSEADDEVKSALSLGEVSSTADEEISLESASLGSGAEKGNSSWAALEDTGTRPQHAYLVATPPSSAGTSIFTRRPDGQQQQPHRTLPGHTRMTQRRQQFPPSLRGLESNNTDIRGNAVTSSASVEPVVVLGIDISSLSATSQFLVCATGVFSFNLSFGALQEFVSVEICSRNLGLFLAMMQFSGYTLLSYILRTYVNQTKDAATSKASAHIHSYPAVPAYMYFGLGGLSAIDMAMTNMAMHYINFPAKTLMKSSRVVFTMIFGVLLAGKHYRMVDYLVVLCMVAGLAIFMQADASSSAIFEPMGVVMLTISLLCDGATNIMSETIMKTYGVGQDELIFRMYSLALIAVTGTAAFKGDLHEGIMWMTKPGTYDEWVEGASEDDITWNALGKIIMIILFSSTGFFGSSCSAAITKNFGALTMSMTSTARRATTLFISFFLFDNECTFEHVAGVVVFITAMTTKSLMSRQRKGPKSRLSLSLPPRTIRDPEMGNTTTKISSTRSIPSDRPELRELVNAPPASTPSKDPSRRTQQFQV